jgi:hypothetical protein
MEEPIAVEYVIASEYSEEMATPVAIIELAKTVDTLSVLVNAIMSISVLLIMVFAVNDDTDKLLPTSVLKDPSLNPTFVPCRVETVSVLTRPEVVMSELPCNDE